jgi:hypothetical protein
MDNAKDRISGMRHENKPLYCVHKFVQLSITGRSCLGKWETILTSIVFSGQLHDLEEWCLLGCYAMWLL